MKVLFLGPECPAVENKILSLGHSLQRIEQPLKISYLEQAQFDFGVSYRYMHIIKKDCVDFFGGNLINMHVSYLPWNRGNDPNFWSFVENTPKGVTIHKIDYGIDTGDILLQEQLNFDLDTETLRTSHKRLACAIEKLFVDNAELLLGNKIVPFKQQGTGSLHRYADKDVLLHLIMDKMWDTPVRELIDDER